MNKPLSFLRQLFLAFIVLSFSAELMKAAERGNREHTVAIENAEQRLIENLESPREPNVEANFSNPGKSRNLLRRIAAPFDFSVRKKRTEIEATEDNLVNLEQTKSEPLAEIRKLPTQPEKSIAPPSPSNPGVTETRKPSRFAAILSNILVRIGIERRNNQQEEKVMLAGSETEQKWLQVLGERPMEDSQNTMETLSAPLGSEIPVVDPSLGNKGWLGRVFASKPSNQTEEKPHSPEQSVGLRSLFRGWNRKPANDPTKPETLPSSPSLLAMQDEGPQPNSELRYLAVNRNRAPIHLIETGTDNTIPLEVDGGKVGRIHGQGKEWSWVQLESGLMGVMRNKYLREAKKEEVANFLAFEGLSVENLDSAVEVAEVDPSAFGGSVSVGSPPIPSKPFPMNPDQKLESQGLGFRE
tara:strand:- start:6912 stop:8147 length:1236 start_codon:yes stop_codon:yes gene_type:complete